MGKVKFTATGGGYAAAECTMARITTVAARLDGAESILSDSNVPVASLELKFRLKA